MYVVIVLDKFVGVVSIVGLEVGTWERSEIELISESG